MMKIATFDIEILKLVLAMDIMWIICRYGHMMDIVHIVTSWTCDDIVDIAHWGVCELSTMIDN